MSNQKSHDLPFSPGIFSILLLLCQSFSTVWPDTRERRLLHTIIMVAIKLSKLINNSCFTSPNSYYCNFTYFTDTSDVIMTKECKQAIINIRNVTRHRNGRNVKSRQTGCEWQLDCVHPHKLIMPIHDLVRLYKLHIPVCMCTWPHA